MYQYNDGGRALAGYKGTAGDCVCRAIAIASNRQYQEVYSDLNSLASTERYSKWKPDKSNANLGVRRVSARKYLIAHGWRWVPTMGIGTGCKVHLRSDELPMGRLIVTISRHWVAVIDGVIHDTDNPSRMGMRCVYGYFIHDEPPVLTSKEG